MFEDLAAEREVIEKLQEGAPLIGYLQQRFGWEFRETVTTKSISPPSDVCREAFAEISQGEESYDRLVRQGMNSYIIRDHFENDHGARRQFRQNVLGEKARWLRSVSKMSGNNWNGCFMIMEMLTNNLRKKGLLVDFELGKLHEIYKDPQEYNQMKFDEKVAYMEQVDDLIYDYLDALSRVTPAN